LAIRMRWKHIIIVLTVLVFAGTALLIALHLPRVQRTVFAFLATRARVSTGTSIEASEFRFNLLRGTVEIRNIEVRSASTIDLPPVATIGSASLYFNPLRLTRGISAFEDIGIRNLAVHVVVERDGRTNLPETNSSTPFDWSSLPPRITIEEGSLLYEDAPRDLRLDLPRLRLALSQNGGGHNLDLALLTPGRLTLEKRFLPVDEIHLSGKLVSSDLEVQSLTVGLPGITAYMRGRIRNHDEPLLELSLKSKLALGGFWKFWGRQDPLDGAVDLDALLTGPLGRLTADVALEAKDMRFAGMDPWSGKGTFRYDQADSVLALSALSAKSSMGALTASGSLSLREKLGRSALKLNAQEVDPYRLMTWFGLAPAISGRASGTANLTWDGFDWRAARLALAMNIAPRESGATQQSIPLGGSLQVDGDPRSLALHLAGIQGPGFHLHGDLHFDRVTEDLQGQFAGDIVDGAALLGSVRRVWPSAMTGMDLPLNGSLHWNARVTGRPAAPRVLAQIESAALQIGRISNLGLTGTVEYHAGLVKFADVDVSWQGQKGQLSGEIDTNRAESPSLNVKAGFDDIALPALLAPFDLQLPVTGRLSGHLTAQGTFADPIVEGTLKCEELQALEENFGTLAGQFQLHGTGLTVETLHLEIPKEAGNGSLEASGSLDWKGDSLRFQATGTGLRLDSLALRNGTKIRGVFSLGAEGETSLSAPAWTAHFGAEEVSVAEQKVGAIRGSVAAQGGRAQVNFEFPDLAVSLRGEAGLTAPFTIAITAESPGIHFSRLGISSIQDILVEGSVAGRIDVAGPLGRPEDLNAKGLMHNLVIRLADREIRGAQPIEVEWKARTLTIIPTSLTSGDATLRIGGSIPMSGSGTGDGLSMDGALPIALLPHLVPGLSETEAKGNIQIHGSLRGSLMNPAPAAEITVRDGELRIPELKTPLTSIVSDMRIDPDVIEVTRLDASLAGGSIRACATIPWSTLSQEGASGTMRGQLELRNIDPGILADIPGDLTGNISLQADVEAPRPELRLLRGTVRFPQLTLRAGKSEAGQFGETLLKIDGGRLSVDHFELRGEGTNLQATGSVSFLDNGALDLKIAGTSDAQLLAPAGGEFGIAGAVDLRLAVGGTARGPLLGGSFDLKDGRFMLATPPFIAENLRAHAEFTGNRATLTGLSGQLNGGQVTAEAGFAFNRDGVQDLRLKIKATNFFLDYPKGLRTASNLDLEARSEGISFLIGGTAQILEGQHREAINLQTLKAGPSSAAGQNPLLERIRLNIQIRTTSPLRVDNNLARVDANADLRLAGTASHPALLGSLELDEGGRVYISERTFTITRAAVTFANEKTIEPTLNLKAQTRIAEYTVTINATGGLKDLQASFTSDPVATEDQIYSLLMTGSVNNTDKILSGNVLSRQALSLFGSSVMGSFNMRVRRVLGVSDFRIEPSLISPDSDPTARLTIGQNFTPDLRLTYSTNLQNSNDKIVIGEYDWRHTILGRYVSQTENADRGELRHKLQFGGGNATGDIRSTRPTKAVRLDALDLDGELALPREAILKQLKLKVGQKYDSFNVQKKLEELSRFYAKKGYLEMTFRQERERDERSVRLKLSINAGRPVIFDYQGFDVPKKVREQVADAWQKGVVDSQRLSATSALVRRQLIRERLCDATVMPRIETGDGAVKTVRFNIVPGPRYERTNLTFEGLQPGLTKGLRTALRRAGLDMESATNPEAVQQEVARHLEGLGYMSAEVARPRVERNPEARTYESVIKVNPGHRYRLGSMQFEGNTGITGRELLKELRAKAGDRYVSAQRDEFTRVLQEFYWRKGYREAVIETMEQRRAADSKVDLQFRIKEDRLSVIAGIQVEGTVETSEAFLRRRIPLKEGQPADGDKLTLIRSRLFNSGTYSMVDLTLEPPGSGTGGPSTEAPATSASTRPLDLKLRVREPKPFSLDYGATYDTSRGAGVIVDFSNRNMLGEGRYVGYSILADREQRNQRLYFNQPFLGRSDIGTTLDLTRTDRRIDQLRTVEQSITLQQQIEFHKRFILSYGYRFQSSNATVGSGNSAVVLENASITGSGNSSSILSTLSRDTRDEVFDATRGSYASQSFEMAPKAFGGSQSYTRYFGQYFKYFGLTRPDKVPFNEVTRPRFILATGLRVGILSPLGGSKVTPDKNFFGGGGSTIRGFAQNDLGPKVNGQPIGGQSLLFLNIELRAPLYKWIDAAAFTDIGNVWFKASDFSLFDLRKTAGFGIRIRNPFIMIRFDYGWKLDLRLGESRGAFHFSIGQAF
jgi:outer membrane protein assembly complex protein YaeT